MNATIVLNVGHLLRLNIELMFSYTLHFEKHIKGETES